VATDGVAVVDALGEDAAEAAGAVTEGADPPHAAADRAMPEITSAIRLLVRSTSGPSLGWVRRAVPALRVYVNGSGHVDRSRHTLMGRASPTYVQIREHQRLNVIESTIASADAWSTAGVPA
jgi:hypothetical protein